MKNLTNLPDFTQSGTMAKARPLASLVPEDCRNIVLVKVTNLKEWYLEHELTRASDLERKASVLRETVKAHTGKDPYGTNSHGYGYGIAMRNLGTIRFPGLTHVFALQYGDDREKAVFLYLSENGTAFEMTSQCVPDCERILDELHLMLYGHRT